MIGKCANVQMCECANGYLYALSSLFSNVKK